MSITYSAENNGNLISLFLFLLMKIVPKEAKASVAACHKTTHGLELCGSGVIFCHPTQSVL